MTSISLWNGLVLTVVSMLVVFLVLAAIWGLTALTSRLVGRDEPVAQPANKQRSASQPKQTDALAVNKKHQKAAELIALVLASEDQPDKKFEITESKRIK